MSARPPSSFGRPGTASASKAMAALQQGAAPGRPPGTASRLTTAMQRPGTNKGVAVPGGGAALGAQLTVAERPMTQQGLGGLKTGAKGPQRQVQDKSFFLGQLRSKVNELKSECARMQKEVEEAHVESSSYLSYEKKAEMLASEIKDLQGELGDYNTLVDKLNTDTDIHEVQRDFNELKGANERELHQIDELFEQKQDKEKQVRQLEIELEQEKRMTDSLVADMPSDMRVAYMKLKERNEHLLAELEKGQQQLDALTLKKENLEEELSMSHVKQEAVRLCEQIRELEAKRDQMLREQQSAETPQVERERLLAQVKQDNHEIGTMERQANELREKISQMQEELHQLDMDIEENQGSMNHKYKELLKREEAMTEFLNTFDSTKALEVDRVTQLETNIVAILEAMGRNMGMTHNLPTPKELASMKTDLSFKHNEMQKSETTASGLATESEKLRQDLEKVEQLESKIKTELEQLKEKIDGMNEELITLTDLDSLKKQAEDRKKRLTEERVTLQKQRDVLKAAVQDLSSKYEAAKILLNENETYVQLGNLERKWQHHEQNNFVMKEFISAKGMESDYRPIASKLADMISGYNQLLIERLSGKQTVK